MLEVEDDEDWKTTEDLGEDEDSLRYLPATYFVTIYRICLRNVTIYRIIYVHNVTIYRICLRNVTIYRIIYVHNVVIYRICLHNVTIYRIIYVHNVAIYIYIMLLFIE